MTVLINPFHGDDVVDDVDGFMSCADDLEISEMDSHDRKKDGEEWRAFAQGCMITQLQQLKRVRLTAPRWRLDRQMDRLDWIRLDWIGLD